MDELMLLNPEPCSWRVFWVVFVRVQGMPVTIWLLLQLVISIQHRLQIVAENCW
jgi:hypothetical protein